ncbi:hypothetical protein [Nodosilinea sp. AN01ver1]|uniref:hypothetical protein n=1 Tax=Nodosilinea sp. AN01ver1 TaxID=3423362 RepID=UPI003D3123A5
MEQLPHTCQQDERQRISVFNFTDYFRCQQVMAFDFGAISIPRKSLLGKGLGQKSGDRSAAILYVAAPVFTARCSTFKEQQFTLC